MSTLFVTATGTEVGKTFVCCRLIESIGAKRPLRVIKPVASGVDTASLAATDTGQLLATQGVPAEFAEFERATPWHFRAPLSPDIAAAREGRTIPFDELVAFSAAAPAPDDRLTIIEGIGGAMVPLDEQHTVLDWMTAINPTVWLVAGTYLGSISHTLTTLQSLLTARLQVGAIVLSESPEPAAGLDQIAAVVRRFSGDVPVLELGRPPNRAQVAQLVAAVPE